jgi:hypothetical protein
MRDIVIYFTHNEREFIEKILYREKNINESLLRKFNSGIEQTLLLEHQKMVKQILQNIRYIDYLNRPTENIKY